MGLLAGIAGTLVARALTRRRPSLDPRLYRRRASEPGIPHVVVVPGIMGSMLCRPDGTPVWLNARNAVGFYNLALPTTLPLAECRDDLVPAGMVGLDGVLPRLFGFTEYADLVSLLTSSGFASAPAEGPLPDAPTHAVFSYDWRRDLVESARRLHESLERLAERTGDRDARFNVIGHSMGGLIARYYLRYGTAEPREDQPVTWAGARRIASLVVVATPSGGGVHALEALLLGARVGLSNTTLSAPVVAGMPSVYQLLPPRRAGALIDDKGDPVDADLHDPSTWERFGWGPHAPARRTLDLADEGRYQAATGYLGAALARARAFQDALARVPETPCPTRVVVLGGECLPTLARGVVSGVRGLPPRFVPLTPAESEAMFEEGDGRVTRASVLASHVPHADPETGAGIPEMASFFFGHADHHGIYGEPTFQSLLLRVLLRPRTGGTAARSVLTPHGVPPGLGGPITGVGHHGHGLAGSVPAGERERPHRPEELREGDRGPAPGAAEAQG